MEIDLKAHIELIDELEGHDDRAWHIAWNPKRPLLASCSADKTVRMYNYSITSSEEAPKFSLNTIIPTGHTKTVRTVSWSPSGKTLATASFDSNIGIWEQEIEQGEEEQGEGSVKGEWECVSLLEGHETECKSVAYSSTGTLLASCSRDKTVWIWEVHPDADFECMGVLMEHSQDVKSVSWHPTEELLASASYDDTIKIYLDDPSDDWFCAATLTGHDSTVWALAWEPKQGNYLASSSEDGTIRLWRRIPSKGEIKFECIKVLSGHERSIYSISWSRGKSLERTAVPEGATDLGWLASTGGDGTVIIWQIIAVSHETKEGEVNIEHKEIARVDAAHGVHDVNSIVWCPRSGLEDVFATAGDDGHIKIWKVLPN